MPELEFVVDGRPLHVEVRDLVVAGWTGRDAKAVEDHILELEAIGVARPRTIPCFYRLGKSLLTTAGEVDVCGLQSSGEVECVLVSAQEGLYVGVGSDHTARNVETYGVTVSKQMCPKPIGRELWRFSDVEDHWDSLRLRSWVTSGEDRILYQDGPATRMRTPDDLVSRYLEGEGRLGGECRLAAGTVLYCGTLALLSGLRPGETFEVELDDPLRHRSLTHTYQVRNLDLMD